MTQARGRVPQALRRRLVAEWRGQCAYCHSVTAVTGARLVVDHIIPEAAGGKTVWENLCVACHSCNEFKGAQVEAEDPVVGTRVRLFHPRRDEWGQHFRWSEDGRRVIGLTAIGRATVAALNLNHPTIAEARRRWARVGWHPPQEDL